MDESYKAVRIPSFREQEEPAFDTPLHVGQPNIGNRAKFLELASGILDSAWYTNDGPMVRELESRIADHLGVAECVAMCNGTVALEIAIRALGLTGEVIVPSYTFVATVHALHWQGLKPVFADIDPDTHNLDPEAVRRKVSSRTSGILGVHLWGRPAPVEDLSRIAEENGLELLFDAAHAFNCSMNGRMIGGFGAAEVFSFHATKFFNTFEGGAVTTNDAALAKRMRLMRNFGFDGLDNVIYSGINGKMTEICAACGLSNFDTLEETVSVNCRNHLAYCEVLESIPGLSMLRFDASERANYQYAVVEVSGRYPASRDETVAMLRRENVLARRYFWPGCHNMSPYSELCPEAWRDLPNTMTVADRVMVLPTGGAVSVEAIRTIGELLRDFAVHCG